MPEKAREFPNGTAFLERARLRFCGNAGSCTQVESDNSFTPLSTGTTAPLPPVGGYSGMIDVAPAAGLIHAILPSFCGRKAPMRKAQTSTPAQRRCARVTTISGLNSVLCPQGRSQHRESALAVAFLFSWLIHPMVTTNV
jgi:hypothetical protein